MVVQDLAVCIRGPRLWLFGVLLKSGKDVKARKNVGQLVRAREVEPSLRLRLYAELTPTLAEVALECRIVNLSECNSLLSINYDILIDNALTASGVN